jgi:hypothetical protein
MISGKSIEVDYYSPFGSGCPGCDCCQAALARLRVWAIIEDAIARCAAMSELVGAPGGGAWLTTGGGAAGWELQPAPATTIKPPHNTIIPLKLLFII